MDFLIVLFKNRKKRKIIKRYHTEKRALDKFNKLIKNNKTILFPKLVENAEPSSYELAILTNKTKIQNSLFLTDDLGRNVPVNLENPEYVFLKIEKKFQMLILTIYCKYNLQGILCILESYLTHF